MLKSYSLALQALLCMTLVAVLPQSANAQCPTGQTEVYIDVTTDDYGYEIYWELLPGTNACGAGTLFSGGNPAVGCAGGGAQNQTPGGYGDNMTVTEGPWCLNDGATYTIEWVDDWGDGGAGFDVLIGSLPVYSFSGAGAGDRFGFIVEPAPERDAAISAVDVPSFTQEGDLEMAVMVENLGSDVISSIELAWSVDGSVQEVATVSGLTIDPFTSARVAHPINWMATVGDHTLDFEVLQVNGNSDLVPDNNKLGKVITVVEATPNLIDVFLWNGGSPTVIGTSADGLNVPRDLDFHPDPTRMEVWVINRDNEATGGSTVTYRDAHTSGQTADWRRDGNAWHFMSLPTGIAFSADNENFATSPGVFDANHDGGVPFTGPTLWSSDPDIYAMPSGGNGSHIDMLHESPLAQGIAWEVGNVFWVSDGESNDVVRYDFVDDHGPGNDYHGDALVIRYPDVPVNRISSQIPSHLVLDHATDWLYVIDGANGEVNRLDINSGVMGGSPSFAALEPLTMYEQKTNAIVQSVATGLVEPCGIDVIEDRLLVSDHATGEIIVYDLSDPLFGELGRIQTTAQNIMGIKVGPDGAIWYVDAGAEELVRLEAITTSAEDPLAISSLKVGPNPSAGEGFLSVTTAVRGEMNLQIVDITGRMLMNREFDVTPGQAIQLVISAPAGTYLVRAQLGATQKTTQWIVVD